MTKQLLNCMKTLIFLFMIAATTCQAKLGETMEQLKARYGSAETTKDVVKNFLHTEFHYRGYVITVIMTNGVCAQEAITKISGDKTLGRDESLTFAATLTGSERNAWKMFIKDEYGEQWHVGGFLLIISGTGDNNMIFITTEAYQAAQMKADRERRDAKIKSDFGGAP